MKRLMKRRIAATALAMALTASMMGGSFTALAAPAQTNVVIKGDADGILNNHTFTAYRVFKGENSTDGTKLVDIFWGDGFDNLGSDTELLKMMNSTEASVTGEEVAEFLEANPVKAKEFAETVRKYVTTTGLKGTPLVVGGNNQLEPGYYLIIDETTNLDGTTVKNPAVLQVTGHGDIEIKLKTDIPKVEKKIWEESPSNEFGGENADFTYSDAVTFLTNDTNWNDVGDYHIGDDVPFKLTATIPAYTVSSDEADAKYSKYTIRFEDVLDPNLTLNMTEGDYKVYYTIDETTAKPANAEPYSLAAKDKLALDKNANKFELEINDITQMKDFDAAKELKVYVVFTAKLTSAAVAGVGEENKVKLHFSNDYTTGGEGVTPDDVVVALTFDTDVDKYTTDADGKKTQLANAEFKLYRVKGTAAPADLKTEEMERDNNGAKEKYYDFTADNIRDMGLELVKFEAAPANGVITVDMDGATETFTTDAGGIMSIHGLDRDTYVLVETKAPDGYNVLKEGIAIKVKNDIGYERQSYKADDYDSAQPYTVIYGKDNATAENHVVGVENKAGSLLPETGGTGTMLLYMAGTVLMAGAVFFVTARGRKKEDEEDAQ